MATQDAGDQGQISLYAENFIIAQEDGDQAYYDRTEEHWDWPEGESGPTVAIGYDCGYVTQTECENDWKGIVPDSTIEALKRGIGITGARAHIFVMNNRDDVTITWAQAVEEFTDRELPKWINRTKLVLPNYLLLSGDCRGALVSLTYNRGEGGYTSSLSRFREMAEIRDRMTKGEFAYIPALIAQMARLWPNSVDLRRRRAQEAQLFAKGLAGCLPLNPGPSPTTSVA